MIGPMKISYRVKIQPWGSSDTIISEVSVPMSHDEPSAGDECTLGVIVEVFGASKLSYQ